MSIVGIERTDYRITVIIVGAKNRLFIYQIDTNNSKKTITKISNNNFK
jgi:hypothetical protein